MDENYYKPIYQAEEFCSLFDTSLVLPEIAFSTYHDFNKTIVIYCKIDSYSFDFLKVLDVERGLIIYIRYSYYLSLTDFIRNNNLLQKTFHEVMTLYELCKE